MNSWLLPGGLHIGYSLEPSPDLIVPLDNKNDMLGLSVKQSGQLYLISLLQLVISLRFFPFVIQ